jgi:ribosomal protein S18 acetylase RimI-like enzyme
MVLDPAVVLDAESAIFANIAAQIPGFHGLVAQDVVLAAIGLPFPRVNSASAARFTPETANRRIDEVVAWFDERDLPFVWRLGPIDQPSDLRDRLLARGFTLDPDDMPGMAAPLARLPAVELPKGATVERVRDAPTFRQWLDVVVAGFGMPQQMGDAFARFELIGFGDELPTRTLLARLDGRPVATALGVLAGGGLVIANVATLAEARGRGIGRAITLATMHEGAESGASMAVLQSTELGLNVYRALGFEEFGRYRVLARLRH